MCLVRGRAGGQGLGQWGTHGELRATTRQAERWKKELLQEEGGVKEEPPFHSSLGTSVAKNSDLLFSLGDREKMFFLSEIFLDDGQTIIYGVYRLIKNFARLCNLLSAVNSDVNKHNFCPQGFKRSGRCAHGAKQKILSGR